MLLICDAIFYEHMLKGLFEYMGESASRWVSTSSRLVAIGLVQVEI